MRFFVSGPSLFGGRIRPGVSFNVGSQRRYGPAPSAAGETPGRGFVYVIAGSHGLIKVGYSANPEARIGNLQTGSPYRLTLVHQAAFPNAYDVEQEAHRLLADCHVLGGEFSDDNEWFAVDKERAIAAVYGAASRLGVPIWQEEPQPSPRFRWRSLPTIVKAFVVAVVTVTLSAIVPDEYSNNTLFYGFLVGCLFMI